MVFRKSEFVSSLDVVFRKHCSHFAVLLDFDYQAQKSCISASVRATSQESIRVSEV
jgi:hypothetical protein